jgi:hypothetical protein
MDEATNQISAAADSDDNPEQIRAEIEDTRAVMSQTINEIQERLSPEHLMDQAKEAVRDATIGKVESVVATISEVTEPALKTIKEVGVTVGDKIWKNPIPLAMIGLGVGMLVMRNFSNGKSSVPRRSLPNRRSNYAIGDVGQMQQNTGASTMNQVKETASDLASRAKDSATAVGTRFSEVLRENPLAVGAVAVAAGTAIGLVLPSTRIESEYIGDTGEKIVDKVEDVARDALGKVQDAAKQMAPDQQGQQQQQPQQPPPQPPPA